MSSKQIQVSVLAPLSGIIVPIEAVPDPAFAQKMVGDGLSIDPRTNVVLSPIAGKVIDLHASRHAVVVEGDSGVRIMVHVGIDTVMLGGEGFDALVAKGDAVTAGQPLLRFDLAHVAAHAASVLTEIVVVNDECVSRMDKREGAVEAGKSVLLTLHVTSQSTDAAAPEQDGEWLVSSFVELPNPAGLHARPAAMLAREARQFSAHIVLSCGSLGANAKSAVDVMALATRQGDQVRLSARGGDAAQALERLARVLLDGCGERIDHVDASGPTPHEPSCAAAATAEVGAFAGVGASPGLVVGHIVQWRGAELEFDETGGTFDDERARLFTALRLASEQIQALVAGDGSAEAGIMDAHLALLDDPALIDAAEANLRTGANAPGAWHQACLAVARRLAGHPSPLLRERATDIRDVGQRVLSLLTGVRRAMPVLGERSIVVADDLTPSDTVSLDRSKIVGLCTVSGGPTSHVAILARSMGIPAICGIDAAALSLSDGASAVLDATAGLLRIDPDPELLADVTRRMHAAAAQRRANEQAAHRIGRTRDGHRVEVVANVRDAAEAREAVASGAEGVGLLRSEFLFEDRAAAPDEHEQAAAYEAVAAALGHDRKCVVRTLDVGGDKPLRYLPLPKEANPFLGLRGIRVSLAYPDLFRSQLRAMLRAAPGGDLHIMFPMVSDLDELRVAKRILQEEQQKYPHPVKVGVMVEVPAAVAIVEALAQEVDFFSIGTNDLAQYTLAIDRGHAKLSSQVDTLHPAVLKMIDLTVVGAHAHGKWVGVCGAMASDPAATAILVGLGVDELSVSVPAIAAIKAQLAALDFDACRTLAQRVLKLGSAAQVRDTIAN
ncbi:phosphoenolpyruvate--protein phosphotransferase [Burkholderia ubonensis]|uniref:phosphoenolpyruvate--protein phosphotransferase n=1 Tax=Burkholderia ubonensis TaxID=101571 RepID=UPI0007542856|nr:phosphoenolpyruvate--protein phosphotransferase [Burkholderia ubonensis]KVA14281.1 PTS mannose transporter subunit IIC [Burkholderia ubonensis]KVA26912.1 PTS mannose transporter subunit IIC [Burkholderia ubonensis]KVA48071.1 PTS mannose transporter subunit IIC [Burkholderia ubonensis]